MIETNKSLRSKINLWWKKLETCQKKTDWLALVAIITIYVLAIYVSSVKLSFVLSFIFLSFLVLHYSFPKALVYSALPLSYASLSQTHQFLVVPSHAITSNQYLEGRHLLYSFSPYFLISLTALIMIFFWRNKQKSKNQKVKSLQSYHFAAIAFVLCGFLSAAYASLIPSLSLIIVVQQLSSLAFVWYFRFILINDSKTAAQKFLVTLFIIVSITITYESIFVIKQFASQFSVDSVGISGFAPTFGLGADESGEFRPYGLQAHPNGLANQHLILLSTLFLIFNFLPKKGLSLPIKKILLLTTSLSLINITLSLSRAAFLAIFVIFLFLWFRHPHLVRKISQSLSKKMHSISSKQFIGLILILIFLFFKLSNRLLYSTYSFSQSGGIFTRAAQYAEALEVFHKSPVLGIGDLMFIPTSYQLFPKGVMTWFPEDVHNGLLLVLIERGTVGMSAYLFFLFLIIKTVKNSTFHRSTRSVIYSGIIASLVMMGFHPERNFLSMSMLLLLSILESKHDYKF